jgi:hypothetical protein
MRYSSYNQDRVVGDFLATISVLSFFRSRIELVKRNYSLQFDVEKSAQIKLAAVSAASRNGTNLNRSGAARQIGGSRRTGSRRVYSALAFRTGHIFG